MNANVNSKTVQILRQLGLSRPLAHTIAYLSEVRTATSREIDRATGLRQPEVSRACVDGKKRGWIKTEQERGGRLGRPINVYSLALPYREIMKQIEDEKLLESDRTQRLIDAARGQTA